VKVLLFVDANFRDSKNLHWFVSSKIHGLILGIKQYYI